MAIGICQTRNRPGRHVGKIAGTVGVWVVAPVVYIVNGVNVQTAAGFLYFKEKTGLYIREMIPYDVVGLV